MDNLVAPVRPSSVTLGPPVRDPTLGRLGSEPQPDRCLNDALDPTRRDRRRHTPHRPLSHMYETRDWEALWRVLEESTRSETLPT